MDFRVKLSSIELVAVLLTLDDENTTVLDLYNAYRRIMGKLFPYKLLGHNSFFSFLKSIPDVIEVSDPLSESLAKVVICDKKKYNFEKPENEPFVLDQKVRKKDVEANITIPNHIRKKICLYLLENPMGVKCDEFEIFIRRFNEINKQDICVEAVIDVLSYYLVSSNGYVKLTNDGRDNILYCTKQSKNNVYSRPITNSAYGALGMQELPKNININDLVSVFIIQLVTPEFVYVHLSSMKQRLNKLEYELRNFYEKDDNRRIYSTADKQIQVDVNYACKFIFNGKWYRVMVCDASEKIAKVQFVDYGATVFVPLNSLYILHDSFYMIPGQAIQVNHNALCPVKGNKWDVRATEELMKLVNQELKMGIRKISESNDFNAPVYECEFICVKERSRLSEILVNDGLAKKVHK